MSRIILSKYDNGQDKFVVGWDHPAGGAFWQEFNKEPEPDPQSGEVEWPEDWEEVSRFSGMWPGLPLDEFLDSLPDDLRPMVTEKVINMLIEHSFDPNSGRIPIIDLTKEEAK